MPDKFDDTIARIDRTSPSLAEALPGIVLLFKMHEDKLAEFDKRIEKTNVDFMKKLDGLADHLDESRHRLHGSINHTDDRATEAMKGVKRMHERIDFLEDRMTDMEARVSAPPRQTALNLTADMESLTAYVTRLETLINDEIKKLTAYVNGQDTKILDIEKELKESIAASDRARVRGDDAMHDLVTRTSNSLYAEINAISAPPTPPFDPARIDALEGKLTELHRLIVANKLALREDMSGLEQRVSDCEMAVGTDKLEPAPQRDTSWHAHDAMVEAVYGDHPKGDERVVVMLRGNDEILRPRRAADHLWDENGTDTIVAWRYAKEGE